MFTEAETLLADKFIYENQIRGYAEIPAPLTGDQVNAAANSFLELVDSPKDLKSLFKPQLLVAGRKNSDIGCIVKTGDDGKPDRKKYFHYHPEAEIIFAQQLAAHNPVIDKFFENARIVYKAAMEVTDHLLKGLERKIPGIHQEFFGVGQPDPGILRFLKYDEIEEGEFIGAAHCDIGALTLGIGEKDPGLEGQKDGIWKVIRYNPDTWLAFRGEQEVPTLSEYSALPHRVRNLTPGKIRWAMVCFVDSKNYPLGKILK